MNKILLLFLIIAFSFKANAQSYSWYIDEGKKLYNKSEFLSALERFDLAYEFAKTDGQKKESRNWKNKCRNQIKEQQIRVQKILNALLPEGVKNIYEYFKTLGDEHYATGAYDEALKNYKLAENAIKNPDNRKTIEKKVQLIEKLIKEKQNGIKRIREKEYFKALLHFENICKANPMDYYSISYKALCNLFVYEMQDFYNNQNDTLKYELSINEITNLQYACFLNDYESDTVKSGKYAGQLMIKNHKWGVVKKNGEWISEPGYENHPVVNVSWYGANEFCEFYGFELPKISLMEEIVKDSSYFYNVWNNTNSGMQTHPVDKKITKNHLNITHNNLLGNVWEWCFFDAKTHDLSKRVIMGGSYATQVIYKDEKGSNSFVIYKSQTIQKLSNNESKEAPKKEFNFYIANILLLNQAVTKPNSFNSSVGFRIKKK